MTFWWDDGVPPMMTREVLLRAGNEGDALWESWVEGVRGSRYDRRREEWSEASFMMSRWSA